MASPNLLMASLMSPAAAAAYVARKNSAPGSVPWSPARNHDPRATRTPFAMHEVKISSSISRMPDARRGCFLWSSFIQSYVFNR